MKHKTIAIVLAFLALFYISGLGKNQQEVLGASTQNINLSHDLAYAQTHISMVTVTAFDQDEIEEYESIPYQTEYKEDDEIECGNEEVTQEGVDGIKTHTYLLTHWQGETIDKQLLNTKIQEPTTEIVSKGTKVVWREHSTPDVGGIKYWAKLDVWATKYDANCVGCTGRTFSGTEVKKGVCATDPKVIPLGTNFYVEGYGLCRAEDIGGAIKGNKIDLGYKVAAEGDWRTGPTTIYLITNAPDGSSAY